MSDMRDEVINPLRGVSGMSWFFEQQVYGIRGVARALKSCEGSGNVPKVVIYDET